MLLLAQAMPCKAGKTSGPVLLPPVVAQSHRFRQNYQCPCHAQAQLVLPSFARSFPYDGLGTDRDFSN
jgi:hypothetical protein